MAPDPTGTAAMFKRHYAWGRTTATTCAAAPALPNPEDSCSGLEAVFVDHIYASHAYNLGAIRSSVCEGERCSAATHSGRYSGREDAPFDYGGQIDKRWYLTAAISGAHTLGRAMPQNSGYFGWWSDHPQQLIFNNDYFKSLLFKGWRPERAAFGNAAKNEWLRADALGDAADLREHVEMMLDTDLCLAYARNGNDLVARGGTCCAWITDDEATQGIFDSDTIEDYCATRIQGRRLQRNGGGGGNGGDGGGGGGGRGRCCSNDLDNIGNDCDNQNAPTGVAYAAVEKFAKNSLAFTHGFAEAWFIGVTNGHAGALRFLSPPATSPPSNPGSCAELSAPAQCTSAGCHWAAGACTHGVVFSWGVVWGDVVPLAPDAVNLTGSGANLDVNLGGVVAQPFQLSQPPPPPFTTDAARLPMGDGPRLMNRGGVLPLEVLAVMTIAAFFALVLAIGGWYFCARRSFATPPPTVKERPTLQKAYPIACLGTLKPSTSEHRADCQTHVHTSLRAV